MQCRLPPWHVYPSAVAVCAASRSCHAVASATTCHVGPSACAQHVFKLEQQLYKDEQLNVGEIPFEDNQLCLDLIELKGGVLAMLDEECVVPNGSDKGFCEKLWNTCVRAVAAATWSAVVDNNIQLSVKIESLRQQDRTGRCGSGTTRRTNTSPSRSLRARRARPPRYCCFDALPSVRFDALLIPRHPSGLQHRALRRHGDVRLQVRRLVAREEQRYTPPRLCDAFDWL